MSKSRKVLLTLFTIVNGTLIFPMIYFLSNYIKNSNENDREGITLETREVIELMSGFLITAGIAALLSTILILIYWRHIGAHKSGIQKFLWGIFVLIGFAPGQLIYLFSSVWPQALPVKKPEEKEVKEEKKYNTL